jgi:hypothetical protein
MIRIVYTRMCTMAVRPNMYVQCGEAYVSIIRERCPIMRENQARLYYFQEPVAGKKSGTLTSCVPPRIPPRRRHQAFAKYACIELGSERASTPFLASSHLISSYQHLQIFTLPFNLPRHFETRNNKQKPLRQRRQNGRRPSPNQPFPRND